MYNIKRMYTTRPNVYKRSKGFPKPNNSLHRSLKWVLLVAQCFGQIPVLGITERHSRFLKFKWTSCKTVYCILNCIGSVFMCGVYMYRIVKFGGNLFDYMTPLLEEPNLYFMDESDSDEDTLTYTATLVFCINTLTVTILFLKLATEWPQLMCKWSSFEFSMRGYGWPQNFHTRITLMSTAVLTLAAVETTIVKISKLYLAMQCKKPNDNFTEYYLKIYLYPEIFEIVDYALWKAILLQIANSFATFAWTFNDLFIMLMSTAIALWFKQITIRLKSLEKDPKAANINTWRDIRKDYNRLATLTRDLDEALSYITMTSFAGNLYFILMQLFNSIRKMKDTLEKIYFFYSFGFLILRTICVCLYGAWIYDESKRPLTVLNAVPSNFYNIEIKRFADQVKYGGIALTGKNFFYVTRGLILTMAGAVVTYELVLIQFNGRLLKESEIQANSTSDECLF